MSASKFVFAFRVRMGVPWWMPCAWSRTAVTTLEPGFGANTVRSRAAMFDECGYDNVLLVEDDLVLASHYIGLVARLLAWATGTFDNVGAVQAWDQCLVSRDEKARNDAFLAKLQNIFQ